MPIYLVRWPGLNASLVRAANPADLLYKLDEIANPQSCTWSVYRGPLWIDLDIPVRVTHPEPKEPKRLKGPKKRGGAEGKEATEGRRFAVSVNDLKLEGVEEFAKHPEAYVSIPGCDTGDEMREAVFEGAFPGIFEALEDAQEILASAEELEEDFDPDEGMDPAIIAGGIREDLELYIQDSWSAESFHRAGGLDLPPPHPGLKYLYQPIEPVEEPKKPKRRKKAEILQLKVEGTKEGMAADATEAGPTEDARTGEFSGSIGKDPGQNGLEGKHPKLRGKK